MDFTLEKIKGIFDRIRFFKGMEFSIQDCACEGVWEQ